MSIAAALRFVAAASWLALVVGGAAKTAHAGGAPERVVLVVNERSWASQTIANHYVAQRAIPASHVIHLDWPEDTVATSLADFRQRILLPIGVEIERRGLTGQIDAIVYSGDFPYRVDFGPELPAEPERPVYLKNHPQGSLTGMTYLAALALLPDAPYANLGTNGYMRLPGDGAPLHPTRGFRHTHTWAPGDDRAAAGQGLRYFLSTMLAYTGGRGLSVSEAIAALDRSAAADATHPAGTIYFLTGGDVRARTRMPWFDAAAAQLGQTGVEALAVAGPLPPAGSQVAGAMIGVAGFDWRRSEATIAPGAICEHLTSLGGILAEDGGQTPLTELLRHGAAGASGTVAEPYAVWPKFPHPYLHLHYARGCTLAEAFYQSVFGPYQLLIVGDPLCRPWASPPQVWVDGVAANQEVSGELRLWPWAIHAAERPIERWELFVDGRLAAACESGGWLTWDSRTVGDGYRELAIVAIEREPIEMEGWRRVPVVVRNDGRSPTAMLASANAATWGDVITVEVRSPGAQQVVLAHQSRVLDQAEGDAARLTVDTRRLGLGPIRLEAIGVYPRAAEVGEGPSRGARRLARSAPLVVNVGPPGEIAPSEPPPDAQLDQWPAGLLLTRGDGEPAAVETTKPGNWLSAAGVAAGEAFELAGWLHVADADLYQLQVRLNGQWRIAIGGATVADATTSDATTSDAAASDNAGWRYAPVRLAAGWHEVRLAGELTDVRSARLRLGAAGCPSWGAPRFRHPPLPSAAAPSEVKPAETKDD